MARLPRTGERSRTACGPRRESRRALALRCARARRGDGMRGNARRDRFHRDAHALGGRAGEQPVEPASRHGGGVRVRGGAVLRASFGRREQFEREVEPAISALERNVERREVFGLGAVGCAVLDHRFEVPPQTDLAAQLDALAGLAIARRQVRPCAVRILRSRPRWLRRESGVPGPPCRARWCPVRRAARRSVRRQGTVRPSCRVRCSGDSSDRGAAFVRWSLAVTCW